MLSKIQHHLRRWKDHTNRMISGIPDEKTCRVSPDLYVGGQYGKQALKTFEEWGIGAIVSLRRTMPPEFVRVPSIAVLHVPTKEHHPPTIESLKTGVEFIAAQINGGKKVYIHCHWGEGRGPSMAIAYLISKGNSFKESLETVKKARFFIRLTPSQITRLLEFEKEFQSS